jgi:hypothetical protein
LPTTHGNGRDGSLGRFVTIREAKAGEVLRGVTFAPRDHGEDDDR